MKVMIIGSAGYMKDIRKHVSKLELMGHEARKAAYDDINDVEFRICSYNKEGIQWADVVHVFWDGRSIGTQFDVGMAFALDKPIEIIKLNPKTLRNFFIQYHDASKVGMFGNVIGFDTVFVEGGRDEG